MSLKDIDGFLAKYFKLAPRATAIFLKIYKIDKDFLKSYLLNKSKQRFLFIATIYFLQKRVSHLRNEKLWPWLRSGGDSVLKKDVVWYLYWRFGVKDQLLPGEIEQLDHTILFLRERKVLLIRKEIPR
jgi:hypothetical protein